jgi:hypothetical protein
MSNNFVAMQIIKVYNFKCQIPELRIENYQVWKEKFLLHLEWMNIDYAIRKDEPSPVT